MKSRSDRQNGTAVLAGKKGSIPRVPLWIMQNRIMVLLTLNPKSIGWFDINGNSVLHGNQYKLKNIKR